MSGFIYPFYSFIEAVNQTSEGGSRHCKYIYSKNESEGSRGCDILPMNRLGFSRNQCFKLISYAVENENAPRQITSYVDYQIGYNYLPI